MEYAIKQLFHINASMENVFQAISTIEGLTNWWTVQTEGNSEVGGSIQFDFGDFKGPEMKVLTKQPYEEVTWECVSSDHGWLGNTVEFHLDENEGKTRVRFSHNGWDEQGDFYALCCFSWGRYLESLRQYCQTGKGEAFGSPGYR